MPYLRRLLTTLSLSTLLVTTAANATQLVNVGLTSIQPPFVVNPETKQGLVYDFLEFLNKKQDKYHFSARLVPVKRLLSTDKYSTPDMIAFNNVEWGWVKRGGIGSLTLTDGRDLFFSLTDNIHPENKGTLAAVTGFHYAFADYQSKNLPKLDYVRLVKNEQAVIRLVEHGRTEKGIISESLLNWISVSEPERYQKFKIDPKEDHSYNRQFITLPSSPIDVEEFNQLLLKCKGPQMDELFALYGLQPPPLKIYKLFSDGS